MLRGAVAGWMGHAAAGLRGCGGAVTRRAHQSGSSRPALYHHAPRVERAVGHAPAGRLSAEALGTANARRRVANEALWEAWSTAAPLPESPQQTLAATGAAMGLRLGPRLLLCALVWPQGRAPSRARGGRWVAQASRLAGGRWAVREQGGQRWVCVWWWEAICGQRAPLCRAVEPHRMTWGAGPRGPARAGESGGPGGAHGPCVPRVIPAAGQGRERGVKRARAARPTAAAGHAAAAVLPLQRGRDVLHPPRALQRVVPGQWPRAARPCATAPAADRPGAPSTPRGRDARGVAQHARTAGRQAAQSCEAAGPTDGGSTRGARAPEQWRTAPQPLRGPAGHQGRRVRSEERTRPALAWRPAPLPAASEAPRRREAGPRVWPWREARPPPPGAPRARLAPLVGMEPALGQRLGPEGPPASARGEARLDRGVRARSAGEGVNRVGRRPQARHRPSRHGLLALNRLAGHGRTCRYGQRTGAWPEA
jgi:hypothetical protein